MPQPHILVIRHMYSADLFTLDDIFRERNYKVTKVEGYTADLKTLNPLDYDAVIVLGGAMGVYDTDKFPFLHDEIALMQKCLAADHPILGICLGAQLMAAAAGEKVYKGTNGKEIGMMNITLTDEGQKSPFRHFDPSLTRILQWHGDTFDLPKSATLLASSDKYVNQAYSIGKKAFAVQFHPEVHLAGFENTLVECSSQVDVLALRAEAQKYMPTMIRQMYAFTDDLLEVWNIV